MSMTTTVSLRFVSVVATLLMVPASGCVQTPAVSCEGGILCPPGTVCVDGLRLCVVQEQKSSCEGQAPAAACSYDGVPDGTCDDRGLCIPAGCGNNVTEADNGEVCDDGNLDPQDGCSADCMSDETCGNGTVDGLLGESCDDGNTVDNDGCQKNCALPFCGDGVLDSDQNEQCDEGDENSNDPGTTCRPNCTFARCGDGIEDPSEVCDHGNLAAGDGCTPDCLSKEVCGNSIPDLLAGEDCDDGNSLAGDGCHGTCTLETAEWIEVPAAPPERGFHAMAFDAHRGVTVLFGGQGLNDTWEYDGTSWVQRFPDDAPLPRSFHTMAYDAARREIVLFGGNGDIGNFDDTWTWDGTNWTERSPATVPAERSEAGMAYDAHRQVIVLFGGESDATFLNDTWEWNGTDWTERTPETGSPPSERRGVTMAYHAGSQRIVLFGGLDLSTFNAMEETWEWDGSSWGQKSPAASPPGLIGAQMSEDHPRGQLVLFAGSTTQFVNNVNNDTWEWNGSNWVQRAPANSPPARHYHAMAYDGARGTSVLFGGNTFPVVDDTWEWDGTDWTKRSTTTAFRRSHAVAAFDAPRGVITIFGGINNAGNPVGQTTRVFDGATWNSKSPTGAPPVNGNRKMVYSEASRTLVLFGDSDGVTPETWEWDGADWNLRTPANSPPPRDGFDLAYDRARGTVVLFGGGIATAPLSDTWEWNGTTWTELFPSASPPGRTRHAMTYDARSERVVLFGGTTEGFIDVADTWEWDGITWTERPAAVPPRARNSHVLRYDSLRGVSILRGGKTSVGPQDDTWEWDGTTWRERLTVLSPPPRENFSMAYDPIRGGLMVYGGVDPDGNRLQDVWMLRFRTALGRREACQGGGDADGDGFAGCADDDCWALCTPACLPGAVCDAGAPACGDGVCNPDLESCRLCPADCDPCDVCGDFLCDGSETVGNCPQDCS